MGNEACIKWNFLPINSHFRTPQLVEYALARAESFRWKSLFHFMKMHRRFMGNGISMPKCRHQDTLFSLLQISSTTSVASEHQEVVHFLDKSTHSRKQKYDRPNSAISLFFPRQSKMKKRNQPFNEFYTVHSAAAAAYTFMHTAQYNGEIRRITIIYC